MKFIDYGTDDVDYEHIHHTIVRVIFSNISLILMKVTLVPLMPKNHIFMDIKSLSSTHLCTNFGENDC